MLGAKKARSPIMNAEQNKPKCTPFAILFVCEECGLTVKKDANKGGHFCGKRRTFLIDRSCFVCPAIFAHSKM
jgi:hypothetical protein